MKKCSCIIWGLVLVTMLAACDIFEPTVPSTPATQPNIPSNSLMQPTDATTIPSGLPGNYPSGKFQWDLYGCLVNEKGEVQENAELSMKVITWDIEDGSDEFAVRFYYPADTIYYDVSGTLLDENSQYTYACRPGFGGEKGSDVVANYLIYFGLDLENECIIIDFDDGQDIYLIASTDPDADISALWEHFQGFFELRPDEWPIVSFG